MREQLAYMRDACDRIEEVAHIIFRMAVRDVLPDEYERVASAWINIEALSLDAESWDAQGLFRPRTQPRDMTAHEAEISRLFRWREGSSLVQNAEYAAPAVYG